MFANMWSLDLGNAGHRVQAAARGWVRGARRLSAGAPTSSPRRGERRGAPALCLASRDASLPCMLTASLPAVLLLALHPAPKLLLAGS